MPNGDSPTGILKVLPHLGVGTLAILLLGAVIYLQAQERRFEAERADRDRELVTQMLQRSVDDAKHDRMLMRERGEQFLSNQTTFIQQQTRLVTAIESQAALLQALKDRQVENTEVMKQSLREETQLLIDVVREKR